MWKVSVKGSKTFNHFHPFGERVGGERPWWKLNRRMSRCTCQCLSKIADWKYFNFTFLQIWQGGYISILLNFSETLRIWSWLMTTHCRLGSQGGLFHTVSRSNSVGGSPQREQRWDRGDPDHWLGEDHCGHEKGDDGDDIVSRFISRGMRRKMTSWPLSAEGRSGSSPWEAPTGTLVAWAPPMECLPSSERIPSLKTKGYFFIRW